MSWIIIGIGGVVLFAILLCYFAPSSKDRRGSSSQRSDDTPLAASRVAEETHHAARVGAFQGDGMVDGVGPFTGTMPRRKDRSENGRKR